MAQFEPLLWERRPRQARWHQIPTQSSPAIDAGVEFAGAPLGKLGRRLLSDIEIYLEFFALARQTASGGTDTAEPRWVRR